jgi:hypothetical protein
MLVDKDKAYCQFKKIRGRYILRDLTSADKNYRSLVFCMGGFLGHKGPQEAQRSPGKKLVWGWANAGPSSINYQILTGNVPGFF